MFQIKSDLVPTSVLNVPAAPLDLPFPPGFPPKESSSSMGSFDFAGNGKASAPAHPNVNQDPIFTEWHDPSLILTQVGFDGAQPAQFVKASEFFSSESSRLAAPKFDWNSMSPQQGDPNGQFDWSSVPVSEAAKRAANFKFKLDTDSVAPTPAVKSAIANIAATALTTDTSTPANPPIPVAIAPAASFVPTPSPVIDLQFAVSQLAPEPQPIQAPTNIEVTWQPIKAADLATGYGSEATDFSMSIYKPAEPVILGDSLLDGLTA